MRKFWAGMHAKVVECALKGAVLMIAKESIYDACVNQGMSLGVSGIIGGFLGGMAQMSVMGPTTYLVTSAARGEKLG